MATNKYSLADHQVIVSVDTAVPNIGGTTIAIGGPGQNGEGSFVGQISVTRTQQLWTTEGDATGSWVHNKNLNRTGTVTIQINQIADIIIQLAQLCNIFESIQENIPGLQLTITSSDSRSPIVTCTDCYIQKIPDLEYQATASNQSWVFTCGRIDYYQ